MIHITDLNDPRIQEFISIKDKTLINQDFFIAETDKVVKKALKSNFFVPKILCTDSYLLENEDITTFDTEIFTAKKELLETIVGFNLHHGVMALVKNNPLSQIDSLGDKIICFNGVTSPENVGTITRAAMAFGFDSIIYDYKSASPFLRRCIRVSMGNVFEAQVHKSNFLPSTIKELQDRGYTVIATANEEGAVSIQDYKYPKKVCIIIGNEGNGMDREVIEACDQKLFIPISDYVTHLNAASAASIFLYHSLNI